MDTRSPRAHPWWLYFLPLLAIVLGVAFLAFDAIVVPETHPPFSPLSEFLYYGAGVLFVVGITASLRTIPLYFVHRRARKGERTSMDTGRKTQRRVLSQHCGRLSLLCFLFFVGLVAALHIVSPEYDPASRFISEYALGAYGYLMTLAFFVLGGGTLFLVTGLFQGLSEGGRSQTGLALLALFGMCALVAGLFHTDPKGGPYTLSGEIHDVNALVGLSSLTLSALLWAFRWRKAAQWRAFARPALVLALLMLVSLVGFFVSPSPLQGLTERVLVAMDIIWLCFTAWKVQAMRPSTRPA